MGKLVQLEVNNFKSYRGHHVLLFGDSYFTSIIGPNGSGKSNSMDAISFVLGIKSAHLRSSQLRDMIYRGRVIRTSKINADGTATEANGDADADPDAEADVEKSSTQTSSQRHDPTTAWVMAIFEDDAEQQHKWKRSITAAGQSEYRIDGRQVSQKAYNDALEEQSILVKARNFLVFQGDVEGVASQNPLKLTEMIEQISGSLEHKEDYKRLKKELEEAETHQTEKLGERRRLNADIKNYQEQKAEADEYEQKVAERDDAIVTHVLWKLFHFQQTIQQSTNEIAKHQEELKEHSRNVEQYERKLNDTKQAHAKSSRDVVKTEKNIRAKEKEIEDAQNNLVPIDAKIDISNKDLSKYEARIAQLNKERNTLTQTIDKYKKDLAVVEKAKKKWEADIQAVAQQQGRDLSAQDLIEYNKLRGEVTKRTFADQTEVNRLQREVETDRDTVRNLKQKVDSLQSTVEKLEGEISQLEEQQQEAKAKGKDLEKEKATKQQAYNKMQSDRRQLENARTELNEHLQEHLRKLYEAEGGQRQSKKEIQSRENVAQMKRIFGSGVYGRVRELCKPKQKKFEKAVETLLGGELEAVIVDKERTAQECIKYLKEHKIGTYKLVPLDVLQVKAVNQNLKGMHPGVRLGIDCIDYDSNLERVFAAACGSSIICDDLKIARHFCYEKKVDVKAVTLDGTVIAKGGTMSGGRLGSDKASSFSDQAVENERRIVEKYRAQLADLPKSSHPLQEEQDLEGELSNLEYQIARTANELRALTRNIESKEKELQHYEGQLGEVLPKYTDKNGRLEKYIQQLTSYQDAVNTVADQIFASFCQRLGYNNIRDYESQQGTFEQEAAEKRLEFTKQTSRLQNMNSHYESQLKAIDERVEALEEKAERDRANIAEFEAEKEELQSSIDVLQAELETLKEQLVRQREAKEKRAAAVTEARAELDKRSTAVAGVKKAVDAEQANIKRTAATRYALLRKCKIDEIKIPLVEGSRSLNQLPIGDAARADPDAMDVDEDPDSTQIQQPDVDDYGIDVDYDVLDDDLKDDDSPACDTKLQETISSLNAEIEKSSPNMRAGDKLAKAQDDFTDKNKDFESARKSATKAKKDFEEVRQQRLELFMKAFNHISENIGGTYKDLTKNPEFPLGGQAYLDMEDSTEPYNAGLKYHAMPPLKRFRDMEHLSGGEKTIAALALLFAVHSYQPSPFFVLDEVDAALDNVNVGRVARYVREHANPGMQFIVISLKAGFFQESESLVGVMRDQSKMSSRVVSLDLRKYQPA